MVIYTQSKFLEIQSIAYFVLAEDRINQFKFKQSKGNNSSVT